MEKMKTCGQCGLELNEDALLGFCPKCLLDLAIQPLSDSPGDGKLGDGESGCRFGNYEVVRLLGRGGMGAVYEAVDLNLHRSVALKVILENNLASPVARRRFTIEAEATAKLDHPNIVPIYEVGEYKERPFLSMRLIQGETLRRRILRGELCLAGARDTGRTILRDRQAAVVRLMVTVARAVHHAHQHGVIHRDLKPGNILVDTQGEPHLTDFGLAKLLDELAAGGVQVTQSGAILGTPGYMSPEQVLSRPLSLATDIHGLGAILYELLTGRPPFTGDTPMETLRQVAEQIPRRPRTVQSKLDKDLDTICMKCLEKEPAARYASAQELADDLERWMRQEPIRARPAGLPLRTRRWVRRNPVGAALITSLGLGLIITSALWLQAGHLKKVRDDVIALQVHDYTKHIESLWTNKAERSVSISSEMLGVIGLETPGKVKINPLRLRYALTLNAAPIARARHYAKLLRRVEQHMEADLGRPVCIDLVFSKPGHAPEALVATGNVDFQRFSPIHYLRTIQNYPDIVPLVTEISEKEGIIFSNQNSGIMSLNQLHGCRMAFAYTNSIISFLAKQELIGAGLKPEDFAYYENIDFTEPSAHDDGTGEDSEQTDTIRDRFAHAEVIRRVLAGDFDAGVGSRRHFENNRHKLPGLRQLKSFPVLPNVIVSRSKLDPLVQKTFLNALLSLTNRVDLEMLGQLHSVPILGFLASQPGDFEELQGVMTNDVSQFDQPCLKAAPDQAASFDASPQPGLLSAP